MSKPKLSPFLRENFAPVHEELVVEELEARGNVPKELNGSYIRNGPNPNLPPGDAYHWFGGDGMLHSVSFSDGKTSYRNRWVRTWELEEEIAAGKELWPGGFRAGHKSPLKNSSNTHIIPVAGTGLALQEGDAPYEIDTETLETRRMMDFDKELAGSFTAHPKMDSKTEELIYFGWHPLRKRIDYGVVDNKSAIVHKTDFELPVTTMMHDCAITDQYTILFDAPLKYRLENIAKTGVPFCWEPENGTRIGILPRHADASEIRWYEMPAFYLYHTGNAYEDGNTVVFTACRQETTTFAGAIAADRTLDPEVNCPQLHEWRLNLDTGAFTERRLDTQSSEFPRVHPDYVGRKNRYTFAAHAAGARGIATAMYTGSFKFDHDTDTITEHIWGEGCFGGENQFVPRPGSTQEDDGWLLGFVYDSQAEASHLSILDARDLEAGEIARVALPQRVPYGFHGDWFPSR